MADQQRAFNEQLFNKQYYQDIVNRTEVSDMLRRLGDRQDTERKRDNAQAAVMGATPELEVAQNAARNKSYAEAIASIASNASTLKDSYLANWQKYGNEYWKSRMGISDKIAGVYGNMANQWSKTADGFYNTATNSAEDAVDFFATGNRGKTVPPVPDTTNS